MDIEGSELFAMRACRRFLGKARVVVAEFYPFMIREVAGATQTSSSSARGVRDHGGYFEGEELPG